MTSVSQFTGSIPEHYDRGLGPHLFEPYARDLARRIAETQPASVLELAAGTGIVTRHLRAALPQTAELIATDLNPPMLAVAEKKFETGEVTFKAADATALPFADARFDALACQFGVMFFPDKDKSYREARRVLRSGGAYIFNVWDRFAVNPFAEVAKTTIGSFFDGDPPTFYQTPFGYFEIEPIRAALINAGFDRVSVDIVSLKQTILDPEAFAQGLVLGNPVVEEIKARGRAPIEDVVATMKSALIDKFGDGGSVPLQAIVFTARA